MSQINPLTLAIIQSPLAQKQIGADKERHVRQRQEQDKRLAVQDDIFEHQVESSEEQQVIKDDASKKQQKEPPRKPKPARNPTEGDEKPHLDLTA